MWIYILNFALILFWGILIKNKKVFVTIASIQIFLILALRSTELGADAGVYAAGFDYISKFSFIDMISKLNIINVADLMYPFSFESGYVVLNWLVSQIFGDFKWLLIIHAGFCVWTCGVFVYRYSYSPVLSFSLFVSLGFYTQFFFILRQTLAMCIMLWSIHFIRARKFVKFFFIFLIAFTIHRAVIVFLPLYFIYNLKITKRRYPVLIMGNFFLLAISPIIANYVLAPILNLFHMSYKLKFNYNNLIVLMVIISVLIFVFSDFKIMFENDNNRLLLWMFMLSIMVEVVGMYNDVVARAVYMLYISVIILIPNIFSRYMNRDVALLGEFLMVMLVFFFMIYQLQDSSIVPYSFVMFELN